MSKRSLNSILVTGGCGFIGTNFIHHLAKHAPASRIVNLDALTYAGNANNLGPLKDSAQYRFVHGNICDQNLVSELLYQENIDCIVNFAAESHVDRSITGPKEFLQTNIMGTFSLLEAQRAAKAKGHDLHFHHVSTDEVYGSLPSTGAFVESTPYDPRSPYSASKAASDHLVRAYANTYELSTTISNCSNNYGPYQFPEKFVPLMILNAKNGKSLPVYGDGKQRRDWLHVEDHCEAIWLILNKAKAGSTYNIGGDCEVENIELLKKVVGVVADYSERSAEEIWTQVEHIQDRLGHDRRYAIDHSLLSKDLGWEPKWTLEKGLLDTVRWYLDSNNDPE